MAKIEDGGQAFPTHPILYSSGDAANAQGMSLRDWFAGLSVQAMQSNPELLEVVSSGSILDGTAIERMARRSYEVADAMLAARAALRAQEGAK